MSVDVNASQLNRNVSVFEAHYAVSLLLLISILAYADRLIMGFLIDPIKADMGVSDTQMGLLVGLAFSLFYALMGLPIGRAIDRFPRPAVLAFCITIWSLCTMLSGAATGIILLFIARCGVGAGEAAMNPAAVSIIGDRFPRDRVIGALSIYSIGVTAGGGLAIILGGQLIEFLSSLSSISLPGFENISVWRAVLIILGVPGLFLAAILLLTIKDPERYFLRRTTDVTVNSRDVDENGFLALIWNRRRAYLPLISGLIAFGFYNYSVLGWYPAMFNRTYNVSPGQISIWYGLSYLGVGVAGALATAPLTRRLAQRNPYNSPMQILYYASIVSLAPAVAGPLMPTFYLSVACFLLSMFMSAISTSISFSAFLLITPPNYRGIVIAAYVMAMNLTAASLSGVFIGLLSDNIYGAANLNRAIATMALVAIPISILCYRSGRETYGAQAAKEEHLGQRP